MADYVERNDKGTLRVAGTRVSLASVVHAYWNGDSPEEIAHNFPSVSLEQVHGAIAYYLANRPQVDAELRDLDAEWDAGRAAAKERNRALREKLAHAKKSRQAS